MGVDKNRLSRNPSGFIWQHAAALPIPGLAFTVLDLKADACLADAVEWPHCGRQCARAELGSTADL